MHSARLALHTVAQTVAEPSPDNICRKPDVARTEIFQINDMITSRNKYAATVVDIEHLITTSDPSEFPDHLTCHGVVDHPRA